MKFITFYSKQRMSFIAPSANAVVAIHARVAKHTKHAWLINVTVNNIWTKHISLCTISFYHSHNGTRDAPDNRLVSVGTAECYPPTHKALKRTTHQKHRVCHSKPQASHVTLRVTPRHWAVTSCVVHSLSVRATLRRDATATGGSTERHNIVTDQGRIDSHRLRHCRGPRRACSMFVAYTVTWTIHCRRLHCDLQRRYSRYQLCCRRHHRHHRRLRRLQRLRPRQSRAGTKVAAALPRRRRRRRRHRPGVPPPRRTGVDPDALLAVTGRWAGRALPCCRSEYVHYCPCDGRPASSLLRRPRRRRRRRRPQPDAAVTASLVSPGAGGGGAVSWQ